MSLYAIPYRKPPRGEYYCNWFFWSHVLRRAVAVLCSRQSSSRTTTTSTRYNCINYTFVLHSVCPTMFTLLRQRRLRCLGHVRRMEDGRIPKVKDILYGEVASGKRSVGRLPTALQRCLQAWHESPGHQHGELGRGSSRPQQKAHLFFTSGWNLEKRKSWPQPT